MPLRLGLPAWAFAGWEGVYLQGQPSLLASYASVFNAVEGNTTFYAVPTIDTVRRWMEAVSGTDLKFSFKLPASVTHGTLGGRPGPASTSPSGMRIGTGMATASSLGVDANQEEVLGPFFSVLQPLASHLGPFLVQFPARIGPMQLDAMQRLFDRLPAAYDYVVEVRHPGFFTSPARLDRVLAERGFGRVIMDTRALYAGDPRHPDVVAAIHEKPDLPVLVDRTSACAFVRLVLHPEALGNEHVLQEWAQRVYDWLRDGITVTFTVHCPNNQYCPPFARDFHDRLGALDNVAVEADQSPLIKPLPAWPVPQQIQLPF